MEAPVKPSAPIIPKVLGSLKVFAISGKFTDFEIRCHGYSFKLHKIIIAAASKHFEVLCGGPFRETTQSHATFDEDPVMIARMVQSLYEGDYGSLAQEKALPVLLDNARKICQIPDCPTDDAEAQIGPVNIVTHTEMYALGDQYDIPNLRSLSLFKFTTSLAGSKTDDVLAATANVYESIPRNDKEMRKHLVYYCQTNMLEISHLAAFQDLMAYADFSWDFGTRYASRAHVWCTSCGTWTRISVDCNCGFHGLCGRSNECTYHLWGNLKCKWCNKKGQVTRDDPEKKKKTKIVREDNNAIACETTTTEPVSPKKRKLTDTLQS